jgi:hypothetical protein
MRPFSTLSYELFDAHSDNGELGLNLLDGRHEDISWVVCQVIHFILDGTDRGETTLLHCERGISRSCSLAIAYRMWSAGEKWKVAYEYVKARRKVSSPNIAFTCNLIELGEIFAGSASEATLLFRCASHGPHDTRTAMLKLCRNRNSRRILVPALSLLNPKGQSSPKAMHVCMVYTHKPWG